MAYSAVFEVGGRVGEWAILRMAPSLASLYNMIVAVSQ